MTSIRRLAPRFLRPIAALALAGTAFAAAAQTKWDLPAAYPATNYHTENLVQFAGDVDKATGGKLKITVHANGSLKVLDDFEARLRKGPIGSDVRGFEMSAATPMETSGFNIR